jgi:hypothetical protein
MIAASTILPESAARASAVASETTAARGHHGIHGGRRDLATPKRMDRYFPKLVRRNAGLVARPQTRRVTPNLAPRWVRR